MKANRLNQKRNPEYCKEGGLSARIPVTALADEAAPATTVKEGLIKI